MYVVHAGTFDKTPVIPITISSIPVERCQTNGCLHIFMSNNQKHIHYSITVLDFVDGTIIYGIRYLY